MRRSNKNKRMNGKAFISLEYDAPTNLSIYSTEVKVIQIVLTINLTAFHEWLIECPVLRLSLFLSFALSPFISFSHTIYLFISVRLAIDFASSIARNSVKCLFINNR